MSFSLKESILLVTQKNAPPYDWIYSIFKLKAELTEGIRMGKVSREHSGSCEKHLLRQCCVLEAAFALGSYLGQMGTTGGGWVKGLVVPLLWVSRRIQMCSSCHELCGTLAMDTWVLTADAAHSTEGLTQFGKGLSIEKPKPGGESAVCLRSCISQGKILAC